MTQYTRMILIGAVVAIVAFGGWFLLKPDTEPAQTPVAQAPANNTPSVSQTGANSAATVQNDVDLSLVTDGFVLGDPNAPITVIEYASMTCSHCAAFHVGDPRTPDTKASFLHLKETYIDTGKVKFIFRPFPLDGIALRASMLAACSGESRYMAFTKVLFDQQRQWAFTQDPITALKQIARQGGMSGAAFDQCMANDALQKAVVQSRYDGQNKYNIQSTPSFVVDGKLHAGALSIETLDEILGD